MGSSFYGTYGCDAPFSLLEKVLQAARVAVPEPAFIAVTGDYVRHFADAMPGGMQDIVGVVRNITLTIDSFFPRVSIWFILVSFEYPCSCGGICEFWF